MPAWVYELDTVTVMGAGLVVLACLSVTLFWIALRWREQRDDARLRTAHESRLHLDAEARAESERRTATACYRKWWYLTIRNVLLQSRLEEIYDDHPWLEPGADLADTDERDIA